MSVLFQPFLFHSGKLLVKQIFLDILEKVKFLPQKEFLFFRQSTVSFILLDGFLQKHLFQENETE